MTRSICAGLTAAALVGSGSYADTIHVPKDHPSIGAAIGAAHPGDTIIVDDGVYTGAANRDLTFFGMDLVLRSANGPANCIIDCQGAGRGFIFDDGETAAAVVEGFTIRHGSAPQGNGGGIDIALSSNPTIRNCVLQNNHAAALGGGMAVRGQCTPLIDGCTFIGNTSFGTEESSEGGGLCLFFLSPARVRNCVFIDNYSEYGGGMSCALSDATVVNCMFLGNTAAVAGGGVASDVSDARFVTCTVAGNFAAFGGGAAGVTHYLESHLTFENSILWDDGPDEIVVFNGTATVRYSDVQGGWSGPGNIDMDPSFVGQSIFPAAADYALGDGSPCVDAGDNAAVPFGVTTDADGQPRFVDDPDTPDTGSGTAPIVDLGALELQVTVCAADLDGDGAVGFGDLVAVLSSWGPCGGCPEDLDGSGAVDFGDLLVILSLWGACP